MAERSDGQSNRSTGRQATRVGGSLWLGDIRRMLHANLSAGPAQVWLVTVTAPGAQSLPCSDLTCGHKGIHPQRERDGCRVSPAAATAWNRHAGDNWSEMHRRALQQTHRAGHDFAPLAGVWQLQTRGVLHLHLVLPYGSPEEICASRHYVNRLRDLRLKFDFGYIDARDRGNGSTVMESGRAAHYLSKYLGESSQLVEAINLRDRPARVVFISRRLTGVTRCTMRNLRRVRFLWWIRQGKSVFANAGRLPRWFLVPSELSEIQGLLRVAPAHAP